MFRNLHNAMYHRQSFLELDIFSLRHRIQAGLKVYAASYSINTGESFQGGKSAEALTSIWCTMLRKARAIPQQH